MVLGTRALASALALVACSGRVSQDEDAHRDVGDDASPPAVAAGQSVSSDGGTAAPRDAGGCLREVVSGDVTTTTQAEVDALRGVTEITGLLSIAPEAGSSGARNRW